MPLVAAILAFIGLTPAPVAPPPLPRRRRRSPNPAGATPSLEPVAPAPLPLIDRAILAVPYVLPAATAVRVLLHEAGEPAQLIGLGGKGKTLADARASLGVDLASYFDLCLAARVPLPSQSIATETSDDAAYRGRLRRACLADLDLWERAQTRRQRECAEAVEDGRREPEALHVPRFVLQALAARKAAQAAARASAQSSREGARAKHTISTAPNPVPPAGPQR